MNAMGEAANMAKGSSMHPQKKPTEKQADKNMMAGSKKPTQYNAHQILVDSN
jgi:hypothetical protein